MERGLLFLRVRAIMRSSRANRDLPFTRAPPLIKLRIARRCATFFFARFRVLYRNAPRFICVRSVCTEKSTVHGKGFEKFTSSRYNEIRTCETFTKMRFGERRSFRADMRMRFIRACGVGKRILKTYVGEER